MLNILVFLKRFSNFWQPASVSYGAIIGLAYGLQSLFSANHTFSIVLLALSALVVLVSFAVVLLRNKIDWDINVIKAFILSSSLAFLSLLMWDEIVLETVIKWHIPWILLVLFIFSWIYRKQFKKLAVTTILKDKLDTEFTVVPEDDDATAKLVAEHLHQQLKDKYFKKIMVRPLTNKYDFKSKMTRFNNAFLTKGKDPKIIFELEVGFQTTLSLENKEMDNDR